MTPYIYQYTIGGAVFLVGLVYAARQGYVGFSGRKLLNLSALVGGFACFAGMQGYLQFAPMTTAPQIPYELVEEGRFSGNVQELVEQFAAFAQQGLQYLVIANVTGSVGGTKEAEARASDFPDLVKHLAEL